MEVTGSVWFDKEECADRICELFGDKSQDNIAKSLGISQGTVSNLKKGGCMSLDTLYIIAAHYHVSLDYLVGLSPVKDRDITKDDMKGIKDICDAIGMDEPAVRGLRSIKGTRTGDGLRNLLFEHMWIKGCIHTYSSGLHTEDDKVIIEEKKIFHSHDPSLLELICDFIAISDDYFSNDVTIELSKDGELSIPSSTDDEGVCISTDLKDDFSVTLKEIILNKKIEAIMNMFQDRKKRILRCSKRKGGKSI